MNWGDGTVGTFTKCVDNLKLGRVADAQDGYAAIQRSLDMLECVY